MRGRIAEAGEAVRENHHGSYVHAPNPTEHTTFADDYPLSLFWVEIDEMTLDIDTGPLMCTLPTAPR